MKTNRWNVKTFLLAAAALAALAALWTGRGLWGSSAEGEPPAASEPAPEAEASEPSDPEARALAPCEHDIPIYTCAECRYEAGVVLLDPSLRVGEGGSGPGLVRTDAVRRSSFRSALALTGEIGLNEGAAVHVSPRVPGVIESVRVDIGTRVRAGDVLFTVTSVELGQALVTFEKSRALAALAEKNFEREKTLFEKKISAEQDMIEARMTYEGHRAEFTAARQALVVLGFDEDDIGEPGGGLLPVRAPIAGTVIAKHAVPGELVEPGSDIMLVADLTALWVWADVREMDLARLLRAKERGPLTAGIAVQAFPGRVFDGRIDYIGALVSEETRTVKVRAVVANDDLALRPGMFCEVRLPLAGDGDAPSGDAGPLAVPRDAVLSDEGLDFVFVQWKGDYFMRREVVKGTELADQVEIRDGIEEGDVIVAEGAFLLKSDILREKMGAGCAD